MAQSPPTALKPVANLTGLSAKSRKYATALPFQSIPSMRSPKNSQDQQIWPISLSHKCTKSRKIIRLWPNLTRSEGDHDTPACKISDHSCHALSLECRKPPSSSIFFFATRIFLWRRSGYSSILVHSPMHFIFHQKAAIGSVPAKIE